MPVKTKISILVIGRNEQHSIAKCLDSAIAAADQIGGAEILYVDSHSTDDTVSVVQSYGVTPLTIPLSFRLSPSAGRFWGSQHAAGEFILFLDADTLIYRDFLPAALSCLENDPTLGGINGYIDDLNEAGEKLVDIEERPDGISDVKWLRGPACLYRREAIKQVGSFNPDLATEEEAELGLRLIKAGWKLRLIPEMMACHTRCYHPQSVKSLISTFRRDIRSKRLGEITKTVAYAFNAGNGVAFCWLRLKTTLLFVVWVAALAMCLLLPEFLFPRLALLLLFLSGGLAISLKKRSLYQGLLFTPSKLLNLVDLLSGLHKIPIGDWRTDSLKVDQRTWPK